MYDASTPPGSPPATDVVGFYLGGDTPHVWTSAELAAQPARYRLPIWVRSNPTPWVARGDSTAAMHRLGRLGAPFPCAVMLDLEEAVTPAYVTAFRALLTPCPVLVYGPSSTIMKNPACAGRFLAQPGPRPAGLAGWIGFQYVQNQRLPTGALVDLSVVDPAVALWDTRAQLHMSRTDQEVPMALTVIRNADGSDTCFAVGAEAPSHATGQTRKGHLLRWRVGPDGKLVAGQGVVDLTDEAGTASPYVVQP